MVKYFSVAQLTVLLFLLSVGCSKNNLPKSVWTPTQLPSATSSPTINPVDRGLLSDLVTSVAQSNADSNKWGVATFLNIPDLVVHPQFGPFPFQCGKAIVVVADTERRAQEAIMASSFLKQNKPIYFLQLNARTQVDTLALSNTFKELSLTSSSPSTAALFNQNNQTHKIKLTPEDMAQRLAQFTQWEGVHLDEAKRALYFVGSQDVLNPQISVSDLTTAYRAIFEHEANGKALFVDMDFNEEKDDYLVTFGGGFEDTRPGRVLYASDLLLKALSSGIDPWSNELPLIESLCSDPQQSAFQKVFCEYINLFAAKDKAKINREIDASLQRLVKGIEQAKTIVRFASTADASSQTGWNYVFSADAETKDEIIDEIKETGYFTDGIARYYVGSGGGNSSKDNTLKLVNEIFDLSPQQKSIVKEARDYQEKEDRILYATLAYSSSSIQNFFKRADRRAANNLLSTINELTGRGIVLHFLFSSLIGDSSDSALESLKESTETALVILHFMMRDQGFTQAFLRLSAEDQETMTLLAYEMINQRGMTKMLNKLQFYQPLCESISKKKQLANSPFVKFVCDHLAKYERSYLADLIRAEIGAKFKTAAEIASTQDQDDDSEAVVTIRYWFFPSNEVLTLADESSLHTFLFNRPNMEAKAEKLGERRGPYEAIDYDEKLPGVQENLDIVNQYYDELSELFPELKELNNLVKMLAFFRWIKNYHADKFDLSAFAETPDMGTPTPRTYPVNETVVALPNGSLLRAVGGVDLHSQTQVGFDAEKMNKFMQQFERHQNGTEFDFEGKSFFIGKPIQKMTSYESGISELLTQQDKKIEIKEDVSARSFTFSQNNRVQWSLSSSLNNLGKKISTLSTYNTDKTLRNIWLTSGFEQTWQISPTGSNMYAIRGNTLNATATETAFTPLREHLNSLNVQNVPATLLWSVFSNPFDDARMLKKNDQILFSFQVNGKTQHWYSPRTTSSAKNIRLFEEQEAAQFLKEPITITQTSNPAIRVIGVQLSSLLPIDSLIMDEYAFRRDTLVSVKIWENGYKQLNIDGWRQATLPGKNPKFQWGNAATKQILLAPAVYENGKGLLGSYELTNWAFMVDAVSNLRARYAGTGKKFALIRELPSSEWSMEIAATPQNRFFVVDTSNFAPHNRKQLLSLVQKFPTKVLILGTTPALPAHTGAAEVVWITTLTERETREQLEKHAKLLGKINRLRVFNTNNPIYDLGDNLFVDCPSLNSVGAWSHIVDFDAFFVLLEKLAQLSTISTLDQHVNSIVQEVQKDYRNRPTPMRLRIARDLEEVRFSWELINLTKMDWRHNKGF